MKLIIDISEGVYKNIDSIQNGSIGSKQIIKKVKNGTPLDNLRAEIAEYKDDKVIHYERNEMIDIVLGIIDKYRVGERDHGHTERD